MADGNKSPEEIGVSFENQVSNETEISPKALKEFEDAIKTREYQGLKVLGEISYGGRRAISVEDKEGRKFTLALGVEGVVNAGVVPDPELDEVADEIHARDWLEKQLLGYESVTAPIDPTIRGSLISTISAKIPGELGFAFKQELLNRTRARIGYHNTALAARFNAGTLYDEFSDMQPSEHREIFNTPGVKEAVQQLELNNGRFFRLSGRNSGGAADIEFTNIQVYLQGLGYAPEQATLAAELAEKTMHIFGESAYYDGIKVAPGTVFHDASGHVIPTPSLGLDGFVSADVVQELYPVLTLTLEERFASFFEEHWDEIDQNASLSGNGAIYLRGTFYYPIALGKPATRNHGRATYLRRYAHTWVNSGMRMIRPGTTDAVRTSMVDVMNNIGSDQAKYFDWTDRVAQAYKGRVTFNDKGVESILNVPLINPNILMHDDSTQAISQVMENYKKAVAAFAGLPEPMRQAAMARLLKGVLRYDDIRNVNRARSEGFNWVGLSQKNMFDIIHWAVQVEAITHEQARRLPQEVAVSTGVAAAQAAFPQLGEGLGVFLKSLFGAITKQ